MSPEEHFRRLKDDDVWGSGAHAQTRSTRPVGVVARRRDRGPIWVTGIVAAVLIVLTVGALQAVPSTHGGAVGARAVAASGSPSPAQAATPTPSPAPSDSRSVAPSGPSLRIYEFDPGSAADMTRANTIIRCFKQHGVRLVGLSPAETSGVENIGFGGPDNDQESIARGLKYSDLCFEAGGPAE